MDAPDFGSMAPGDRGPALRSYVERYLAGIEDPSAAPMTGRSFNRRMFAIERVVRSPEEHGTAIPSDLTACVSAAWDRRQSLILAVARTHRPSRAERLRGQEAPR